MSQSFGRRSQAKTPPPVMAKFSRPARQAAPAPAVPDAVDDEIREWKKARGSNFPVKLLALVASVSFGVASVALPQVVNDWVQYPLYALSAASLYIGFARRKPRPPGN